MSSFWMDECSILDIWDFWKLPASHFFKFQPKTKDLKMPTSGVSNSRKKKNGVWKISDLGTTPPLQISSFSQSHDFFGIHGKMDLEKLVWTPSISVQLPEALSCYEPSPSKTLFFRLDPKRAKSQIPGFLDVLIPRFPSGIPGGTGSAWRGNRLLGKH